MHARCTPILRGVFLFVVTNRFHKEGSGRRGASFLVAAFLVGHPPPETMQRIVPLSLLAFAVAAIARTPAPKSPARPRRATSNHAVKDTCGALGADGLLITVKDQVEQRRTRAGGGTGIVETVPEEAPASERYRTKLLNRLAEGKHHGRKLADGTPEHVGGALSLVPVVSAWLSDETLAQVLEDDEVVAVEANCIVQASQNSPDLGVQRSPTWGLDRIDSCNPSCAGQPSPPALDQTYTYGRATGEGAFVYGAPYSVCHPTCPACPARPM